VNATPDKKMAAAFQAAFAGGAQTVEWMSKTRSASLINGDCGTYGKLTTKFLATDDTKLNAGSTPSHPTTLSRSRAAHKISGYLTGTRPVRRQQRTGVGVARAVCVVPWAGCTSSFWGRSLRFRLASREGSPSTK
jgi:hypothetical protein